MNDQFREPAPLVDEAIEASFKDRVDVVELSDFGAEICRLGDALSGIRLLAVEDLRQRIRLQPLAAGFAVATVACLYGLTR